MPLAVNNDGSTTVLRITPVGARRAKPARVSESEIHFTGQGWTAPTGGKKTKNLRFLLDSRSMPARHSRLRKPDSMNPENKRMGWGLWRKQASRKDTRGLPDFGCVVLQQLPYGTFAVGLREDVPANGTSEIRQWICW